MTAGRVAQAFDLAGITKAAGAPSFAHFAKGGSRKRLHQWAAHIGLPYVRCRPGSMRDKNAQAASPPTLARNARMGHPLWEWRKQTSFKGHPPDHVENGFTFHECLLLASWCGQLGPASLREGTSVVRYRGG
jgi:hypothetical protein